MRQFYPHLLQVPDNFQSVIEKSALRAMRLVLSQFFNHRLKNLCRSSMAMSPKVGGSLDALGKWLARYRCRGRITFACCVFAMPWPANSTRAKRWPEAGRCDNLTGRSTRSFTNAPRCRRTRPRCCVKGEKPKPEDAVSADEEIRNPLVLEFLNLKDEYSESDLEEALIRHLETFLLELGNEFAFVARQRRLRIGHEWFRVDLLFFHRRLRCLVIIDLKIGGLVHADIGQMNLYCNYARATLDATRRTSARGLDSLHGQG